MANENASAWPQTASGEIDWESAFENPQTGLIALIVQARTPAALRKSTTLVIKSIYAHDGAPPEIAGFVDELEHMLPDDLPESALPKITTAITTVLREIKDDRIRQQADHATLDDFEDADDLGDGDDEDTAGKTRWWNRKKKKSRKPHKPTKPTKRGKRRKGGFVVIFASLVLLICLSVGGVYYYYVIGRDPDLTRVLIDQMAQAAKGDGPDRHVFGWPLTVEKRSGLVGVTAEGVPSGACASAAWYFVNRGNVLINDKMPGKASPTVLRQFCEEKGQRAKLTWLSKQVPAATIGESSSGGN